MAITSSFGGGLGGGSRSLGLISSLRGAQEAKDQTDRLRRQAIIGLIQAGDPTFIGGIAGPALRSGAEQSGSGRSAAAALGGGGGFGFNGGGAVGFGGGSSRTPEALAGLTARSANRDIRNRQEKSAQSAELAQIISSVVGTIGQLANVGGSVLNASSVQGTGSQAGGVQTGGNAGLGTATRISGAISPTVGSLLNLYQQYLQSGAR